MSCSLYHANIGTEFQNHSLYQAVVLAGIQEVVLKEVKATPLKVRGWDLHLR